MSKPRSSRLHGPRSAALGALLTALGIAGPAAATGMQGHIYMAQCGAEMTGDPRLKAIFAANGERLANGAFFPDSGYTADDHDQGEIAHWEQYVEGYIQIIRDRYAAPYDSPEAAQHIAFLMGIAAHGITDSTFDSILMARAGQIEPSDLSSFDTAMDIFLVHDQPRYYIPELNFDSQTLADVYNLEVLHPVEPDAIDDAMSTARSGIAAVSNLLYVGADDYGAKYPWARGQILNAGAPGGYAFGARVVAGYYREILRRLDGDTKADQVVIGTYPDASYPLVTLDNTRPDGKIVLFFGEGIDRATIDDTAVTVRDGMGNIVPAKVDVFRGDKWANVITVGADTPWQPGTKYTATLSKTIKTLSGASPSQDIELSFETCTPAAGSTDCPAPAGPSLVSPCPETDAKYVKRPGDEPEEPPVDPPVDPPKEDPPKADPPKTTDTAGGCAVEPGLPGTQSMLAGLALAFAAFGVRLRRRR